MRGLHICSFVGWNGLLELQKLSPKSRVPFDFCLLNQSKQKVEFKKTPGFKPSTIIYPFLKECLKPKPKVQVRHPLPRYRHCRALPTELLVAGLDNFIFNVTVRKVPVRENCSYFCVGASDSIERLALNA